MTTPPTAAAVLIAPGGLAHCAWVLEAVLPTGLTPTRACVSELAAGDQPYGALLRGTDLAAGVLVRAGGLSAPRSASGRGRRMRAGPAGLVLFGAASALDACPPLDCAPTADAVCAAREHAGLVPAAHGLTRALALCGALVATAALTRAARGTAPDAPATRACTVLVALALAATVCTPAAVGALEAGHDGWGHGVAQRLQAGAVAVRLTAHAPAHVRPPARTRPGGRTPLAGPRGTGGARHASQGAPR
ncbi:DUF998 domain-containing protein [Streptomyces fructofermentans]|uniref:DUF998 domain-containing protein n=1 Tax=Streptomyces fructofermentans TaxID=152141 RepID=UPI0033D3DB62